MKYIVYCTRNSKNAKIYIGVHGTKTPFKFDGYLGCGVTTDGQNKEKTYFQKAVAKYGVNNFIRTVIAVFDNEDEAYALEEILVDEKFVKRKDTYNLALGGKNLNLDHVSIKKKTAKYDLQGKLVATFNSIKDAANSIGVHETSISDVANYKCNTCGGYVWRIFEDKPDKFIKLNLNKFKVVQYSKTGYKKKTWESAAEAAKSLNCDRATITACCKLKRKSCGGYQWRYFEDGLESVDAI